MLVAAVLVPSVSWSQPLCGVERWPVKIASDDDAARIDTLPIATTVAELTRIERPQANFGHRQRVSPVEFQTFIVRAILVRVIASEDSDLHLVLRDLKDDRLTLVAEIPHPGCTAGASLAARFEAARQALRGTPRNGFIEVVGIGFFDSPHGQSGMAQNGIEIHPVLSLKVLR